MSNRVTLGGERLGSGKKMKVELHGFERSTHDLSYIWRSTMSSGTLVPFMNEVGLPGDTFDIHLNCDIKTHPTIGPLFGSFKVQLDVFMIPARLYLSGTHNNMLGVGMKMNQMILPKVAIQGEKFSDSVQDWDNWQVNPSCIFSYLGIRGIGNIRPEEERFEARKFNAIPWLGYWEIYKNYYANKQEEEGVVIHTGAPSIIKNVSGVNLIRNGSSPIPQRPGSVFVGARNDTFFTVTYSGLDAPIPKTVILYDINRKGYAIEDICKTRVDFGSYLQFEYDFDRWGALDFTSWDYVDVNTIDPAPKLERFKLDNIDKMREAILATPPFTEFLTNARATFEPYNLATELVLLDNDEFSPTIYNQEGLAVKTYQSDLFNNWLSTDWITGVGGINDITKIDTTSGSFNLDTLMLSRKVYDMLNRIAVSGGSYNDWISAVYDHESYRGVESPMYLGGLIKELVFQEVVNNSASSDDSGTQPLGTLAGKGVMGQKHKGGDIVVKCDEPCFIMGIVSLTPRVDYSQGNKWHVNLDTFDDFHKPNLDQIGFQELISEQMAYWTSTKVVGIDVYEKKSVGKQPAWINYMTNVNEVRGNFAIEGNEMFMTLNRKYEPLVKGLYQDIEIKDMTTYIDPSKFNQIFAQTSLDAQNFWTQISVDITARRKMSAKVIPNL